MGRFQTRAAGVALVSLAILVACIQANTVECGDLACPAAMQCVADRCVTDEQVGACRDRVEGEPCAAASVLNGHCIADACVDSICGNGVLELGELCDDGNTDDQDGCAARCDSAEVCGNGVVDLFREQCDEGLGTRSGDGCSSQCAVEYPTWRRETPRALEGRYDHAMVTIDQATGAGSTILLFGGGTATAATTSETWLWQADQWRQLRPRTSPPAHRNPVLVYDGRRDRVVMFGGEGPLLEVWEWDGVDWSPVPQTGAPPAAVIAGAYHAATKEVIVFDGSVTHRWDGTGWLKVTGIQPPQRTRTTMAYLATSANTGVIVLFGGRSTQALLDDTWTFDGTEWRLHTGTMRPTPRQAAVMAAGSSRRSCATRAC